jgi:hypothetical protein
MAQLAFAMDRDFWEQCDPGQTFTVRPDVALTCCSR